MLVHFGRKPGRCEQVDFIAIELRVVIEDHITSTDPLQEKLPSTATPPIPSWDEL